MRIINNCQMYHKLAVIFCFSIVSIFYPIDREIYAKESPRKFRLPDTGQTGSYTQTFGEDGDYSLNPPSFRDDTDGTISDSVTELMWQKIDGGEMTFENAVSYCANLSIDGHNDWRLPTCHELFALLDHSRLNPALDTIYFTTSQAEYWWSCDKQVNDTLKIWVANAGGGMGPHHRNETI